MPAGHITPHSSQGHTLPAVKLDYARQEHINLSASAVVQANPMDASLVYVFAYGGNARVLVGTNPVVTATTGFPLPNGCFFPVVKDRDEKIAVISMDNPALGAVDIIPAAEVV